MLLADAHELARLRMYEYGLDDWHFAFDRAVRRFGWCSYDKRTLSLSRKLVELNDRDHVENVILHEIAHALAGPGTHHGPVWRRIATDIGCTGERCYPDEVLTPKRRWRGVCANCGYTTASHRRRDIYHGPCGPLLGQIRWEPNA